MYAYSSITALIPTAITLVISSSCLVYLAISKNYKPLFWVYAVAGSLLAHFAMNYVLSFTHYVDFMWVVISIILAFIGLGWVYGVLFIFGNAVGLAYFYWFTLNTHIQVLEPKTNVEILADYIEVLFAFFVVAYLMRQFILFQTYSENSLIKANEDLAKQNKLIQSKNNENETLMKEIHHRVKNNLQIIISLLRMQSAELKSRESQEHFSEAINRILAMALIHQKLYSSKELSKVNIKSYLEQLVMEIVAIFPGRDKVSVRVETCIDQMSLDTIVPLGLLINELISNSLKHAFRENEQGAITIGIRQKGEKFEVTYSDNGQWKEPNTEVSSFGLELVDILTDQLNGTKEMNTENGTHYRFILSDTIPA